MAFENNYERRILLKTFGSPVLDPDTLPYFVTMRTTACFESICEYISKEKSRRNLEGHMMAYQVQQFRGITYYDIRFEVEDDAIRIKLMVNE